MIWADYLVLLCAVVIIASVLMQNSSDDIKDAFSGEKSELFKNQNKFLMYFLDLFNGWMVFT